MSITVTATQGGSTDIGTGLLVRVVTGQAASPAGASASATSPVPSLPVTPTGTGSWVYGSNLGVSGTYTPNAATTYQQQSPQSGLELIGLRSSATTTSGTPVTLGGTATAASIAITLLEILKGTGLAEDASSPAAVVSGTIAATTAAFTPPGSSLLVAMVNSNGGGAVTTMAVTDTSGLTWTEQVKQDGAGNGYTGIWTAAVPGGGIAHTATVSLTVTPAVSAGRTRGKYRTAALTVTPSVTASRARGHYRTVAIAVTPQVTAARTRGRFRSVALSVIPSVSVGRSQGHVRRVLLNVVPSVVALATGGQAKGERQLVRLAIAAYFGGTLVTADAGVACQGGPLTAHGLGTAYPYSVKGVPDSYYTAGQPDGQGYGVIMSTTKVQRRTVRDSYGGATSGWRMRRYAITCELAMICELPHIEVAGAALDNLIDAFYALIAADRTLGTNGAPGGVQIIQAGEGNGAGGPGIDDVTDKFEEIDHDKGRYAAAATVSFEVLTMVVG